MNEYLKEFISLKENYYKKDGNKSSVLLYINLQTNSLQ